MDETIISGEAIGAEVAEATRTDRPESPDLGAFSPEELVEDIRRSIACIAHCQARVIALIDEVDRRGLWAQWVGVTSLANWVMHVAAVSAHTAREYVRVMTALREMPRVRQSLARGDVSYSKVREVTRLVGRIPEEDALRLAHEATGGQIAVVVRNYRRLSAVDEDDELPRLLPADSVSLRSTEPGRARITIDLAEDDAAEIVTMLDAARQVLERRPDGQGADDAEPDRPRERVSQVMCLMEIVRAFPRAVPAGRLDADRARMLIHVSAEVIAGRAAQSAGTEAQPEGTRVPAGTPEPAPGVDETDETCRIDGFGGIGAATARRLSCEALIGAVLKDGAGDVLALGRSRRLVSRRQRRALSARDIGCQFPGCRSRRHCDAHHIRPWSQGGTTDLDNLILLCRAHHTAVHEHGLSIRRREAPFAGKLHGGAAFAFFTPDGSELLPLGDDWRAKQVFETARLVKSVRETTSEADPSTRGGGWGFNLANCLAWMVEAERRHARDSGIAA